MAKSVRGRKTVAAIAVCCSLSGLVVGCSAQHSEEGAVSAAALPSGSARAISIVHALGTTKLQAPARRVVALDDSWADAVLFLGGEVVGTVDTHAHGTGLGSYLGPLLPVVAPPVVGTGKEPDFAAIAALNPDLIVGAKETSGDYYPELSEIAPTIMSEGGPATWKGTYKILGRALGREDAAEVALAEYAEQARAVGAAINEHAGNPTISIVRFQHGPTRLYGAGSFAGMVLADAQLSRPKSQRSESVFTKIEPSKVDDIAADKIFIATSALAGPHAREGFAGTRQWQEWENHMVPATDETWITSQSLPGAYAILSELAAAFDVPPPVLPAALRP